MFNGEPIDKDTLVKAGITTKNKARHIFDDKQPTFDKSDCYGFNYTEVKGFREVFNLSSEYLYFGLEDEESED
jgi:hypothetical protein